MPIGHEIILVPGLWYGPGSMSFIGARLRRPGYNIRFFSYRSTKATAEDCAGSLAELVREAPPGAPPHLVGHSLGGLLILRLLAMSHAPPIGRVVLLAVLPPTEKEQLEPVLSAEGSAGIDLRLEDGKAVITSVQPGSSGDTIGLKPGMFVQSINGKTIEEIQAQNLWNTIFGASEIGVPVELQIQRAGQVPFTLLLETAWVTIKSGLHYKVITLSGSRVGYFIFNQFINTAKTDIDAAFAEFRNNGITGLVIDLRYNPGGSLNLVKYLGELIAGSHVAGKTCLKLVHNDRYSDCRLIIRDKLQMIPLRIVEIQRADMQPLVYSRIDLQPQALERILSVSKSSSATLSAM